MEWKGRETLNKTVTIYSHDHSQWEQELRLLIYSHYTGVQGWEKRVTCLFVYLAK